ncbi:MAG TPA: class I SAM-dependent methyltransferase [Gammaproteobacteria bacterium]|jgi:SAM-dependent methyltransferase|nr:class I SAM-dependent methyltransferase [Gammaproteobacteria bacterium]
MNIESRHYHGVAAHYDNLAGHGIYGTLAPHNRGGRKSEYVGAVFDAAMLPLIRGQRFASLLDFGCGTGVFSRQAADLIEGVVGVDVSPLILDVARGVCAQMPNVQLLLIDGEHLPFGDVSFDCAVARETLCYVPDARLEIVFAEVYRTLTPGGRFLVIDQVSNDPYWQTYAGTPQQVKRAPSDIRSCAARAGFLLQDEYAVRTPRFPAVYLAWSGLVPRFLFPKLARFETTWHRKRRQPVHRWWDAMFQFVKPP